ncbi:MAG: hypothetical protein ACJAT2_001582 [Bacteriovoracaceae bacterium]
MTRKEVITVKVSNSRVFLTMLVGAFVLLMSLPGKANETTETPAAIEGTLLASNDDESLVEDDASSEVVPAPAFIAPENEDSTSEDETFVEE